MQKETALSTILVFFVSIICIAREPVEQVSDQQIVAIKEIVGTVQKMDMQNRSITVEQSRSGVNYEHTFNASTMFLKEGKVIKASDIQRGDRVSVRIGPKSSIIKVIVMNKE